MLSDALPRSQTGECESLALPNASAAISAMLRQAARLAESAKSTESTVLLVTLSTSPTTDWDSPMRQSTSSFVHRPLTSAQATAMDTLTKNPRHPTGSTPLARPAMNRPVRAAISGANISGGLNSAPVFDAESRRRARAARVPPTIATAMHRPVMAIRRGQGGAGRCHQAKDRLRYPFIPDHRWGYGARRLAHPLPAGPTNTRPSAAAIRRRRNLPAKGAKPGSRAASRRTPPWPTEYLYAPDLAPGSR